MPLVLFRQELVDPLDAFRVFLGLSNQARALQKRNAT